MAAAAPPEIPFRLQRQHVELNPLL